MNIFDFHLPSIAPVAAASAAMTMAFCAIAGEVASCKYDEVLVRTTTDSAAALVEGIRSGDVEAVDEALDSGAIGIDEPICISTGMGGGTLKTKGVHWSLPDFDMVAAANATFNKTGDPLNNMYIPATPGVSMSDSGWTQIPDNPMALSAMGPVVQLHGTALMVAARLGNRSMVKHLLERGANPNVFVVVGRASNGAHGILGRDMISRPYLFALEECYRTIGGKDKTRDKMDSCAKLLIDAGAVLPSADKQGRNGLWDAAIARSIPMLELALAQKIDVNATDHLDKTVMEYIAETPVRDGELAAFAAKLRAVGAKGGAQQEGMAQPKPMGEDEDDVLPPPKAQGSGTAGLPAPVQPFQPVRPTGDDAARAAEISCLERNLVALRRQLLDAEHDANMAALDGRISIVTSMRIQNIQRAISEVEGRLLELQR